MRVLDDMFFEALYDRFPVVRAVEEWMFESFVSIPRCIEHDAGDIICEGICDIMVSIIDEERDVFFLADDRFREVGLAAVIYEVEIRYGYHGKMSHEPCLGIFSMEMFMPRGDDREGFFQSSEEHDAISRMRDGRTIPEEVPSPKYIEFRITHISTIESRTVVVDNLGFFSYLEHLPSSMELIDASHDGLCECLIEVERDMCMETPVERFYMGHVSEYREKAEKVKKLIFRDFFS